MKLNASVLGGCLLLFNSVLIAGSPILEADFSKEQSSYLSEWKGLETGLQTGDVEYKDGGLLIDALKKDKELYFKLSPESVDLPVEYTLEVVATPLDYGENNAGHFGISIDGLKLVVRSGLIVFLDDSSQELGANRVNSIKTGTVNGAPTNREISLTIQNRKDKVEAFIDGKLFATALKNKDFDPGLHFWAWNSDVLLKKLKLTDGIKTNVSANLIRNSSFEVTTNPDAPDYWGTVHWGMYRIGGFRTNMDEFRKRWHPDESVAFDGKKSFRIWADGPNPELSLYSNQAFLQQDQEYVLSVYAKSDVEGLPFTMMVTGNTEPVSFTASTEWKRYSMTFKCKDAHSVDARKIAIAPQGNGTLRLDAVQLELGSVPTAYAKLQTEIETDTSRPTVTAALTATTQPPVLDGTLTDPSWTKIGELLGPNGERAAERTVVYACYDDSNLYFAAECFDQDIKSLKTDIKKDGVNIWGDDSVEIFIKPTANGNSYLQYVVNAANAKYSTKTMAERRWSGSWRTTTKVLDDRWIAEAAIPISDLGLRNNTDFLTFNFCRNFPRLGGAPASWSPTTSFHDFTKWGRINLKLGAVLSADKVKLFRPIGSKNYELSVRLSNPTAQPVSCAVSLEGDGVDAKQDVVIAANSDLECKFANIDAVPDVSKTLTLTARRDGQTLLYAKQGVYPTPPIRLTPEYSYFSNEPEIRIKASITGSATKLKYAVLDRDGKEFTKGVADLSADGSGLIAFPNNLSPGTYELVTEADAGSGASEKMSVQFRVSAHLAGESKINYWRRSIYSDGKEFFAWHILMETSHLDEELMKLFADSGFNMVELGAHFSTPEFHTSKVAEEVENTLKLCDKYGMKARFVLDGQEGRVPNYNKQIELRPLFEKYRHVVPSILLIDEAYGSKVTEAEVAEFTKLLRKGFGEDWPLFHNEEATGILQNFSMKGADIVGLDHYPIPDVDIASTWTYLNRLKQNVDPKQVLAVYLQSCGNAFWLGREPTAAELYQQVYSALVLDCWNMLFFANVPLNQHVFPTLKKIRGERDTLIDMGVPSAEEREIKVSNQGNVKILAKELDDSYVIVAVNLARQGCDNVEFSGLPLPGDVQVMFEGRELPVKDGKFVDNFQPLERHVYKIQKKK